MIEIIPNWHPILVHFSVGLLLTAALFHLAAIFAGNDSLKQTFTHVANWNLWAGVLITVATVAAGWFAFNSVNHDTPSHLAMIEHRNWALVTFAAYLLVGLWSLYRAKQHVPLQWPLVIAVCAAGILLISTAWHGGELVYRHGLGVMSLPNPDEHAHGQGAAHDHSHDEHAHEQTSEKPEGQEHTNHEHEMQPAQHEDQDASTELETPLSEETKSSDQPPSEQTHEPGHENHDHAH